MKEQKIRPDLIPILLLCTALLAGCRGRAVTAPPSPQPTPSPLPTATVSAEPQPDYGQEAPIYTDGGSGDQTWAGEAWLDEDGTYSSKDDVALYLYQYGQLPDNFITKSEARDLGWTGGGLERYAPGKSIGGDYFGNYEKLLPQGSYHECDINTTGADSRGAERLVWDDDGNIYYTGDHYESFELVYAAQD